MSKGKKKPSGNPAGFSNGPRAQLDLMQQRLMFGAYTVGSLRQLTDPEGNLMAALLTELKAACDADETAAPSQLILPGRAGEQRQVDRRQSLLTALNRCGINDAAGLWRAIEACTSSAAGMAMLWAEDAGGATTIGLRDVVEHALAFRPEHVQMIDPHLTQHENETAASFDIPDDFRG